MKIGLRPGKCMALGDCFAVMHASMLSYWIARGLFVGLGQGVDVGASLLLLFHLLLHADRMLLYDFLE